MPQLTLTPDYLAYLRGLVASDPSQPGAITVINPAAAYLAAAIIPRSQGTYGLAVRAVNQVADGVISSPNNAGWPDVFAHWSIPYDTAGIQAVAEQLRAAGIPVED